MVGVVFGILVLVRKCSAVIDSTKASCVPPLFLSLQFFFFFGSNSDTHTL